MFIPLLCLKVISRSVIIRLLEAPRGRGGTGTIYLGPQAVRSYACTCAYIVLITIMQISQKN